MIIRTFVVLISAVAIYNMVNAKPEPVTAAANFTVTAENGTPAATDAAVSEPSAPERTIRAIDQPAMRLAIAAIPMQTKWQAIRVDDLDHNEVSLTILYHDEPSLLEAEIDAKGVTRILIQEIVREGKNPAADSTNIHVGALQVGLRGETGQSLVKNFGTTTYDWNDDQITFSRPWF